MLPRILSWELSRDRAIRVHVAVQIRFGARIIEFVALHMAVVNQAVQIGNRFRNRVRVFAPRIIRCYRNWLRNRPRVTVTSGKYVF